jgi:hypothetical protein
MATTRRVLLCGRSLLFSGLQATLETTPGVDFQIADPDPESIWATMVQWQPNVLILESEFLQNEFALSLLKDFPKLKIIGVGLVENQMLVFSSQLSHKPRTRDLLQIIEE